MADILNDHCVHCGRPVRYRLDSVGLCIFCYTHAISDENKRDKA